MKTIKIKYFNESEELEEFTIGDWIDLKSNIDIEYKRGDIFKIPLGVGMILPKKYEANVVPRSSTRKKFGIIQTNHFGVIDNSYSGDEDEWQFEAYAVEDGKICKSDRICQFRINKIQPKVKFKTVSKLRDKSRGGYGTTGK